METKKGIQVKEKMAKKSGNKFKMEIKKNK